MKPEIIISQKPLFILRGSSLIMVVVFIGGYIWNMNKLSLDIPYLYIGLVLLIVYVLAKFAPKIELKINETGFEYKKGSKMITDTWLNVREIGIQRSRGKPYAFFIGGDHYKTGLIDFYFIELNFGDKKEIGYVDRILEVLKDYSGINPVFSDHFLYNKDRRLPAVLWTLIILVFIFGILFNFRFL